MAQGGIFTRTYLFLEKKEHKIYIIKYIIFVNKIKKEEIKK